MRLRGLLIMLWMVAFSLPTVAQTDYRPLLKEGKVWNMYYSNYSRSYEFNICVSVLGDTIVDDEQCYKVTSETKDIATGNVISKGGSIAVFLEKDRKVYERRNDIWRLLYDFNLQPGDVKVVNDATKQEVMAIDGVEVNGDTFRRMTLKETYVYNGDSVSVTGYWVEGVGSSFGLLSPDNWTAMDGTFYLESCIENGECIFSVSDFDKRGFDINTVDHPVDMTSRIVNPRFDNNDVTTGWSGTRLYCYDTHENAEVYSNTFDVFQKVEGLPKGVYAVGVKAFYIAGGDLAKSYNYFKTNDEASHFAKLYVDVEGQQRETSICSVYENDRTEPLGCDGEKSLTDDEMGKTYYFPYYSLAAAERYMHELNCYDNKVLAMTGGTLTLGVRKSKEIGGDWSVFDDFSLTYYGNGADAYQMYLDDVQQANENETIDEGTLYTEMYLNDVRRHRTATSETEVSEALADIQSAYAALQRNIDLWKDWKQMMDRGNGIAGAPCFAGSEQAQQLTQRCTVEAVETEAARSLTNEQLEAEISETEQLINALYDLDCAPGKMLVEGKQWVYTHYRDSLVYDGNGIPYDVVRVVTKVVYTISGDTLIDGRSYVKLYRQEESEAPVYWMGLCEEGGTIYWCNREKNQAERFIEYNPIYLNEHITDIYMPDMRDEIDYVTVNDRLFIRHNYSFGYTGMIVSAVEGVGYEQCGILGMFFLFTPSNYVRFEACYEDGECIFTAADFYKPGINTGIESMYNGQDAKNNGMQEGTRNNVLFDLQGRRIQGSPKHGVYIQNGKKVMK